MNSSLARAAGSILIVDDEPQNRKLLEVMLRPEGYVTRTAANGEEALASVADNAPDLILLDVMMPGMDGYQVAATLKADAATSNIPIIMVTAQIDRSARVAGLDAGAEEFLTKPVDRAELWLRVRNLLRLKAFSDFLQNHSSILEQEVQTRTADLQRFRVAMDATVDAITLVNRSTMQFVEVNATACTLFGYTREEFLQMDPSQICSVTRRQLESTYDALIAGEETSAVMETELLHKDGTLFPAEMRRHAYRSGEDWIIVAVVSDITERKKAAQNLLASERRFSNMLENVQLVSVMLDLEARITYCNEYLLKLTGWQHQEVIGQDWFEIFMPPELGDMRPVFASLLANLPEAWHVENEIFTRSRERRLIRWNNSVLRSAAGDVIGVASIGEDITDRREAEARIIYLNRVYAVLSSINTLIVRVRNREELFRDASNIVVEKGGFRMAYIGIIDRNSTKMTMAAATGVGEEFLAQLTQSFAANEGAAMGGSLTAQAIRGKKAIVANNFRKDSKILLRKQHVAAGIHSIAILPLIVSNEVVGVLGLYATENEFFHDEEMKLLNELAGDIAFAVDHIGKQERLDYLAYYDALTGLANRSLFLERLKPYIHNTVASGQQLALFLIDLERFKNINDTLGHAAGDALLRQVGEWLVMRAGDANLVARVGADQFAVVFPEAKSDRNLLRLVEKAMMAFLEHPFRLDNGVFRIAAKIGVAVFPDHGADAESLFRNAEAALKNAKASGDRYLFYTQKMTERVAGKLTLENQLRQALDRGEFVLHYQPKLNLVSRKVTGCEALIRWNNPRTGLVPPAQFIPVMEETGLIYDVGRWALGQAIADYLRWSSAGLAVVRIAVNVSPLQLRHRDFIAEVAKAISIDPRASKGLELEITESVIMGDIEHNTASLQAVRAMGVSIAIDDFGTGFSSLSYLSKLPVNTLKIDRSFIINMTVSPEGLALVSTIINLAHALKLKVVAEGVETEEQSNLLHLLNCDEMQGYLFSKPVPSDEFEAKYLALPASADVQP